MVQKKPSAITENVSRPLWNSDQPFGLISQEISTLFSKEQAGKLSTGMHNAGQTGYVSWKFDAEKFPTLELLHITDVQLGHILCRVDKVLEYRDWVLAKPNRFMLWGGDMIDAGTKESVGSPWEQMCEPQGQVYQFCKMWAPAKHRVLGFIGGNHERRGIPTFGDLGGLLSFILQIPYTGTQQRVDIKYGEHNPFSIRLWHGSGTSQTAGAKMNMIDRFMNRGDNDLYLTGHLHDAMTKFKWREVRDTDSLKIRFKKIGGAMSSSFLQYQYGYAEQKNLEPSGLMMARVILEPNGHWELTLR